MLGLDRCYPRPRRKDCDPSCVDILFGLPSGGVAGAQPPANGLNPFGVPLLPQRLVHNDERSSLGNPVFQALACEARRSRSFLDRVPKLELGNEQIGVSRIALYRITPYRFIYQTKGRNQWDAEVHLE